MQPPCLFGQPCAFGLARRHASLALLLPLLAVLFLACSKRAQQAGRAHVKGALQNKAALHTGVAQRSAAQAAAGSPAFPHKQDAPPPLPLIQLTRRLQQLRRQLAVLLVLVGVLSSLRARAGRTGLVWAQGQRPPGGLPARKDVTRQ